MSFSIFVSKAASKKEAIEQIDANPQSKDLPAPIRKMMVSLLDKMPEAPRYSMSVTGTIHPKEKLPSSLSIFVSNSFVDDPLP
jgi:hypothetical protein